MHGKERKHQREQSEATSLQASSGLFPSAPRSSDHGPQRWRQLCRWGKGAGSLPSKPLAMSYLHGICKRQELFSSYFGRKMWEDNAPRASSILFCLENNVDVFFSAKAVSEAILE